MEIQWIFQEKYNWSGRLGII